jgi:hypothetical protein
MTSPAVGDDATAGWADARPPAACGQTAIRTTAVSTPKSGTITFPVVRFSAAPLVVCTLNAVGLTGGTCAVTGISTSGATIWLNTASAASEAINWIAMQNL